MRVLVVDDVALARWIIRNALEEDPAITVVGEAADGLEAVALTERLRPDVITMDVLMPVLDGYAATQRIMATYPTPVVAVTSLPLADGTVRARLLECGAVAVVGKAFGRDPDKLARMRRELVAAVKAAAAARSTLPGPARPLVGGAGGPESAASPRPRRVSAVVVAASTGGPAALQVFLGGVDRSIGCPVLVVQHIAEGFTTWLAEWLAGGTELPVRVGQDLEPARPGHVYLAPYDQHMRITSEGVIRLNRTLPVRNLRPSADVLFQSAAQGFGPAVVGVVLSGMGSDGAEGARAIRQAGGVVLVQDAETSAIWGMPQAVIAAGAADAVLPPPAIAARLLALIRGEAAP
ncbi:MAG: chemotaxis-specific protein-glutamate methyltransferase CheB [Armatimonadetes bacterium]|nr:chemotaxis-specific protein-glutamate methyltransferase CheB [Armatimonadota bacterium]